MRQPIQFEMRGLMTPRERIWRAIVACDAKGLPLHRALVQDHCEPMVRFTAVDDYFDDLAAAGYIKQDGTRAPKAGKLGITHLYRLVKPSPTAPRVDAQGKNLPTSNTAAMWQAMKVLAVFDYTDIAKAATLGTCIVKPTTAKAYVNTLARAGYLMPTRAAKPGTPARYRLHNNTGPQAPAITRLKTVFDRNTGSFAHLQTAQEVCDGL